MPGVDGLTITEDDCSGAAIRALIAFHVADAERLSPPENVHALPAERLREPDVTLYSAWLDRTLVGCGALKTVGPGHGEVKAMRVAPAYLGRGIGEAILLHLLDEARRRGYAKVSLETGRPAAFAPARRLYAKHGFIPCAPFGAYRNDDFSLCMTREV